MKSISKLLAVILACFFSSNLAAAQRPAKEILDEALAAAKRDQKEVFLLFGATGCGWCKIFDRFLESEGIKPIFGKYFVVAHLQLGEDAAANPGASEIHQKLKPAGGVPFHAFLKADGAVIIDSKENGNGGNIGYPAEPNEIKWFMTMLERAAPKMSPDERNVIEAKLRAFKRPTSSTS
jgi:hypothetical protein